MSEAPAPPPAEPAPPAAPETFTLEDSGGTPAAPTPNSWWTSLVLIPLGLVSAAVALFLFLSWMVGSGPESAEDLLSTIHSGGYNARKQAFYEFMDLLAKYPSEEARELLPPALDQKLASLFDASTPDMALARYADTQALVVLGSPLAYERVVRMVQDARPSGGAIDPSTPLERFNLVETEQLNPLTHGLQLLGRLGDVRAVPLLQEFLEAPDEGQRMAAAFAMGGIDDAAVLAPLQRALTDENREVRRNAALSLARRGDAAGVPVLIGMLDPEGYAGYGNQLSLRDEQMRVALFALRQLRADAARPQVEALADSREVSGTVASAARQWLEDMDQGWPEGS